MTLFGYTIKFLRETTTWASEDKWHVLQLIIQIERVTPAEKEHREFLEAEGMVK